MSDSGPDPIAALVGGFAEWNGFVAQLRERNRHFPANRAYMETLVAECMERRHVVPASTNLYRARRMPVNDEHATEPLALAEMGPPPAEKAASGRLNPDGLPYYYLTLEKETAIAEVRPWIMARVTVATLKAREDLDLVDLRVPTEPTAASPSLRSVAYILQRPVYPRDEDPWAYLGTQYIAERLKADGAIGIVYDSGLRPGGTNVALFEDRRIRRVAAELFEVTAVMHTSALVSGPTAGADLGFR